MLNFSSPHLESRSAARAYMADLERAWTLARTESQAAKSENYDLLVPSELLRAVQKARDLEESSNAWEAINYLNEAFRSALQKIEDQTFQAMLDFEAEANDHGYYVSLRLRPTVLS